MTGSQRGGHPESTSSSISAVDQAEFGLSCLDRFATNADPVILREGIAQLEFALTDERLAEHPDLPLWRYFLGLGYRDRGLSGGGLADHERCVEMLDLAREGMPLGSEGRDLVTVDLAEARFWLHLAVADDTPDDVSASEALLLADLRALRDSCADPECRAAVDTLACQVELDRALADGDVPSHGPEVHQLAGALIGLPEDAPFLLDSWHTLADAALELYRSSLDGADLELAVHAADRSIALSGANDPTWPYINKTAAAVWHARWQATGDVSDLDRALEHQAVPAEEPGASWWRRCQFGELLRIRALESTDSSMIDRAVAILTDAAADTPNDDEDAWMVWVSLGEAHSQRWRACGAQPDLEAWSGSIRTALRLGIPEPDALLQAYNDVLTNDYQAFVSHGKTADAEFARGYRQDVEDVYRALADTSAAADADLHRMAGVLAAATEMFLFSVDLVEFDVDRVRHHLNRGNDLANPPGGWRGLVDFQAGTLDYYLDTISGQGTDFGRARLIEAINNGGLDENLLGTVTQSLSIAQTASGTFTGDRDSFDTAGELLRQEGVAQSVGADTDVHLLGLLVRFANAARSAPADPAQLLTIAEQARAALDRMPEMDDPASRMLRSMLAFMAEIGYLAGGSPGGPLPTLPISVTGRDDSFAGHLDKLATLLALGRELARAVTSGQPARLVGVLRRVAEVADEVPDDSPVRFLPVNLLGVGWQHLSKATPSNRAMVESAVRWSREAVALAGGPERPLWPQQAMQLATALRARDAAGDRAESRGYGLSALRGRAWSALLQSGIEHAMAVVRPAADEALLVAGWCAEDGDHDGLVHALDAGRGLVLHAATASRTVADRLIELGRPDLAGEWARTEGTGSQEILAGPASSVRAAGDLRHRVFSALTADEQPSVTRLLDPPDIDTIRTALCTHGSDALVYLVPATHGYAGFAVLVPAAGDVRVLPLPELRVDTGSTVARYAQVYERWRQTGSDRTRREEWRTALSDILDWAWHAAGHDLLTTITPLTTEMPRLILIPVGMLALIPWHAARHTHQHHPRYLIQDAVISYSPSARMLCETVNRPAPPGGATLIVGNPTGDLPSAGTEAHALHQAFYPHAPYLGQPHNQPTHDSTGTPTDILNWLTDNSTPRSTLHLACHAHAEPSAPMNSRIILANGQPLLARHLLDHTPTQRIALDRVLLAACTTNLSGNDYDEAFSLATAFLAAGTRTAYASLWPVPDGHTSLLMFMLHHHLNTTHCTTADALHHAQLWMLNPTRTPPDTMPDELLLTTDLTYPANDPTNWAGFTHLGA